MISLYRVISQHISAYHITSLRSSWWEGVTPVPPPPIQSRGGGGKGTPVPQNPVVVTGRGPLLECPPSSLLRSELNKLNKSHQILRGSFSSVSTATIARKDAFCSIFRDLQDLQSFAPLKSQNFSKKRLKIFVILNNHSFKFSHFLTWTRYFSSRFCWKIIGISRKCSKLSKFVEMF